MSADDNTPEQAREVEVVAVHQIHGDQCLCGFKSPVARDRTRHIVDLTVLALAPVRAAARQEAAREALTEAASTVTGEMFGGRGDDVRLLLLAISRQQQRRADGVTGRSGT